MQNMAFVHILGVVLLLIVCLGHSNGFVMTKCLKLLVNKDFQKTCSELVGNRIRPCLVKTQKDVESLLAAKVISKGLPVPRDNICAALPETKNADCISVRYRDNSQITWQWSEWRRSSGAFVRNIVIDDNGTNYTCPYQDRKEVFTDCQDAYMKGFITSGVLKISLDGGTEIDVYCEQELDHGGWTVIQRRQDGQVDFYRTWAEYKAGFGNLLGEYWLGNDYIHLLTKDGSQVKFKLSSSDGESAFADYSWFKIEDESENYRLHIGGYSNATIPGDSMTVFHNGNMFSTKDRDNNEHCAVGFHGAWWYGSPCHQSNLNGLYGSTTFGEGLNWHTWKGREHSMVHTEVMVRRMP